MLPQLQATRRIHAHALSFDVVKFSDPAQRLGSDRALVSGIEIKELPARMRQTGQFRNPLCK